MALLTFLPENTEPQKHNPPPSKRKKRDNPTDQTQKPHKPQKPKKEAPPKQQASSWGQIKNLLTCKQIEGSRVHDPSKNSPSGPSTTSTHHLSPSKLGSSCSSICSFRDVAHGNTRVVHRADHSPDVANSATPNSETRLLTRKPGQQGSSSSRSLTSGSTRSNASGSYTSSSTTSSFRAMQFRKLSGCYECHMIVDPSRYPISPRVCACSQCGEVFPKLESLELHQAVRHAVSELGPDDSGRNIVEIIFKSSWLKKDSPICQIERILKVHNTQRTIQRFEDCRDAVKSRALQTTRKDARCAADGNELLRFHCTTLTCSLGSRGSSSLCSNLPGCGVCTVIRHGFQGKSNANAGVRTTASSGRADDLLTCSDDARRVMLVCRVIAGRVKRVDLPAADSTAAVEQKSPADDNSAAGVSSSGGVFDSVTVNAGVYSNMEELVVYNPRSILPCFVVIYKVLES